MNREEFVENIKIGDKLISVGLDDYGQSYFIEFVEDYQLKTESCGSYNCDYKGYIEYRFGDPEKCVYYQTNEAIPLKNCEERGTYGWCDRCKYNDVKWYSHNLLVELGIIDRRGNILEPFQDYIVKKDSENKG